MRTYGRAWLASEGWNIKAEPHIMLRLKRIFERVCKGDYGTAHLSNTPENCRDLLWFIQRYPLDVEDLKELKKGARRHREKIARLEDILGGRYRPTRNTLAIPLREYQTQAVELYLTKRSLLVGDDVGIGKTAVAIGSFTDPRTLPAVVVTLTFLPRQWELYRTHGREVRVEGNCICPTPDYENGFGIGLYHVDTPAGLKALADMIKGILRRHESSGQEEKT